MHLRSIQTPQRRRPYSLCSEAIGLALSSRSKPLADGVCVLATQRTRHRVPEGGVMISPPCWMSRSPSKDYVDAIGERAVTGSHCRTTLKAEFGSCHKPTPQCPADSGCRRPTTRRAAQPAVEMLVAPSAASSPAGELRAPDGAASAPVPGASTTEKEPMLSVSPVCPASGASLQIRMLSPPKVTVSSDTSWALMHRAPCTG